MIDKIAITLLISVESFVLCHLKDMGEAILNWTTLNEYELEHRINGGTTVDLKDYPFNVQFFNYDCQFIYGHKSNIHYIWDFIVHEHYNETTVFSNDVAVIIIHDKFVLGPYVQKAILIDNDVWMNENETSFIGTGWGKLEKNNIKNNKHNGLMMVQLRYISRDKCSHMNNVQLSPDMFCLYGDGRGDTCHGDSGGGILWNRRIVGIVSHGRGCGKTPSMYGNVYYLKPWIEVAVKELYKRFCRFHYHE
ncbi:trypsin epsilon-like isoform X2 [Galleria mellonella]|uniref:Trypsin epsilon-like isoform X2 n=1 Tax=Galleria mellonella TaxID=7137 RepID=A0ABM3N4R7_GALME|nr:trypsin epsilon-like isoform X2 [Galleria mellonella]